MQMWTHHWLAETLATNNFNHFIVRSSHMAISLLFLSMRWHLGLTQCRLQKDPHTQPCLTSLSAGWQRPREGMNSDEPERTLRFLEAPQALQAKDPVWVRGERDRGINCVREGQELQGPSTGNLPSADRNLGDTTLDFNRDCKRGKSQSRFQFHRRRFVSSIMSTSYGIIYYNSVSKAQW